MFLLLSSIVASDCLFYLLEINIENALNAGVRTVEVERKQNKVTVSGYVDANKVLNRVKRRTGKLAEMWPYKPYHLVYYPYAAQVYDKKAPSGYVRNVDATFPNPERTDERYTSIFSDENPNACSVM